MPVYNSKPVTRWADPSQASVMDSPLQQAMRLLGQALGGADPNSVMPDPSIGVAPLIATVPREAAETLVPRLLRHWTGWAEQNNTVVPDSVQQAVEWLAAKFPRVASHMDSVNRLAADVPDTRGMFEPNPWVGAPNQRAGSVFVKEGMEPHQIRQTLTHEATHAGQKLREGSYMVGGTGQYAKDAQRVGYWNNPAELRARIAQLNQQYREMGLFSDNAARLRAATHDAQVMGNPYVTTLGEKEIERLDNGGWR